MLKKKIITALLATVTVLAMLLSTAGCISTGDSTETFNSLFDAVHESGKIERSGSNSSWGSYTMTVKTSGITVYEKGKENITPEDITFSFKWGDNYLYIVFQANKLYSTDVTFSDETEYFSARFDSVATKPKVDVLHGASNNYTGETYEKGSSEYSQLLEEVVENISVAKPIIDDFMQQILNDSSVSMKNLY